MKTTSLRRADFVKPRLPEARVARMWSAVEAAQVLPRPRRAARFGLAVALAAAACVALAVWAFPLLTQRKHAEPRVLASGDMLATEAQQRQVTLPDGSVLALGPSTRMQVVLIAPDAVRLRLVRGALTCDVPRLQDRQFVVQAGVADVTVKGTRFTVELEPGATRQPELSVSVERGRVQLRADGQTLTATLDAGQKWSSEKAAPSVLAPEASSVPSDASVMETPKLLPTAPSQPDARELMERANAARLAGQPAEAAREYARLVKSYPSDVRAGLAGFELGRIRLNSLGDPRGAVTAFRFALSHTGAGFFSEDAAAGIVEGLNRAGDTKGCASARDSFIARYPGSAHAAHVRGLCE